MDQVRWLALLWVWTFASLAVSETVMVFPASARAASQCALCLTLEQALANVASNTELLLMPGVHMLHSFSLLQDVSNVTLSGTGDASQAVITCIDGVGLGAVNLTSLRVMNLTVDGCGLNGTNLNDVITYLNKSVDLFYQVPPVVKIAVFLGQCRDVNFENVIINGTAGIGLLVINAIGNCSFKGVNFVGNSNWNGIFCFPGFVDYSKVGGGAVFLYQDYKPEYAAEFRSTANQLNLDQSTFFKNRACSFQAITQYYTLSRTFRDFGYTIGFGGGLSVILGQSQFAVAFQVSNSRFESNSAYVAGAAYVGIFTYARNSSIAFIKCIFDSNEATYLGGGIGVLNDMDRYDGSIITEQGSMKTVVIINGSTFERCYAGLAAAIFITSTRFSNRIVSGSVRIFLIQSILRQNLGLQGALPGGLIVDCRETLADGRHLGMQLEILDTVISESALTNSPSASINKSVAAVYVYGMNVTLSGNTSIRDNSMTGLTARGGVIGIHGNIDFINNTGVFGGAINLVAFSFLVFTSNSSLRMINNTALALGGALYVDQESNEGFEQCFLYFGRDQFTYCSDCSNLNNTGVQIVFSGNRAYRGNDIYGSTLIKCRWAGGYYDATYLNLNQLFPTVFNFDKVPQGIENIEALPSTIEITSEQPVYPLSPGQTIVLNLSIYDELRQRRQDVISSFVANSQTNTANDYTFLLNGAGVVSIDETNYMVSLTLLAVNEVPGIIVLQIYSTTSSDVSQLITVEVRNCLDGFEFNNKAQKCQCTQLLADRGITCNEESLDFFVPYGKWLGYVDCHLTVLPTCPAKYCQYCTFNTTVCTNGTVVVKNESIDLQCISVLNRGGIGCRTCKANYSETFGINSLCMQCTDKYLLIIVGGLLAGVVLTWGIAYLRLTVSLGCIHGILFYCNILSVYAGQLASVNSGYFLVFASWLTLNIGVDTCFYNGMSSVGRVGFGFIFPAYIFGILLAITFIARFEVSVCCRRSCSVVHFSTVQMFATLLILCYTLLMEATVEALAPYMVTSIDGNATLRWFTDLEVRYFSDPGHIAVGVLGISVAILYIIPLPLVLLIPRLSYELRFLRLLKPLYDIVWDPFKPRLRCWLSFQLWFTTGAFALQYFAQPPNNIFAVLILLIVSLFMLTSLRPYKSEWVNIFNSFLIIDMIIIFVGALFYNKSMPHAITDSFTDQDIFTLVFVLVAYLSIIALFLYHMFQKFVRPKCRVASARKGAGNLTQQVHSTEMAPRITTDKVVGFSVLREPLLEN